MIRGNATIRILAAVALLALGGFFANRLLNSIESKNAENNAEKMEAAGNDSVAFSDSSAQLLAFGPKTYTEAVRSGKLVVLYFYANWCPLCKKEFPVMQEVFNELETDGVIGFRVNYNDSDTDDAEKAVAREFEVLYQHTKVFVKDGKRVLKSPESWDKARYLLEINKFL